MHMKKIFRMYLALALMVLGVTTASADERISLQDVPFNAWDGWGADAQATGTAECLWVIGEGAKNVYGDEGVNNYADLSLYSKLIVVATDGTPRFLFNRDIDEGQWSDNEADSHLIDNTKGGWSARYFSQESGENEGETVYTVDLKLMAKEKGFAHLHAIKGANWSNVTVHSMEVVRQGKAQQVGWTSVVNNGDMEGEDVSSFFVALNATVNPDYEPATITDGVGRDGSRGIMVTSIDNATETWATQFFVRFNEPLAEGTKWRISFDAKADKAAEIGTGCHGEPRQWQSGGLFSQFNVADDWATYSYEGVVSADNAKENGLISIAFDLNVLKEEANNYYFDNIKFEVYKYGTTAEFSNDVVLVDFGFDTNLADLVKQSGKTRLLFPTNCAQVKVNGEPVELYSVEGFDDGRFYIFLQNAVLESDVVTVSFENPTDAAFHLTYTSGPGGDVNSFADVEAALNSDIEDNEGYPYDYLTPVVVKAEPEDGSFNLPNSIKDFKLTFDKEVDCAAIKATINGKAMTVTPATDFAAEITLTREGTDDLPTGEYTINVTKIYPKLKLDESIFGDTTYVVNIGKVEIDPNDVARDIVPMDYFNNCAAGSVPEGFLLVADNEEQRVPGGNYGSGARMMDFAAGGDFTKGLYLRTNYLEYGTMEDHYLDLEAGKKYKVSFNSCRWKADGQWLKFCVLDADGNEVMTEVVENNPDVNEKRDAVSGTTYFEKNFIPETTGRYTMRWIVAKDAQGTETGNDWRNGVVLANVRVMYVPNVVGIEEMQLLNTALENAKATRDGNAAERYQGEAFTALAAAIEKYEAEKDGYTAPTAYKEAAAVLDAASQAVKDHRALCDNFDAQIKQAIDVVRQNELPDGGAKPATKFVATELFGQLKDLVAKYHGTSEWRNVADTIANPEAEPVWQLFYEYDVLTDDAALSAAVAELSTIGNTTKLLFTEGESKCAETGVKVLAERLRLGAEALKVLGVAEDDELVLAALNTLTDDDELAHKVQLRLKERVYGQLKEAGNEMFKPEIDEVTLEETTPEYDMTVFVKNPNVYRNYGNNVNFTAENVLGWDTPTGYNRPGLSTGWSDPCNNNALVPSDCMFQTWGSSYRVEQTVTDLPAGVYTIVMGFGERNSEDDLTDSYIYAKTSDTPEYVEPAEGEVPTDEEFAGKTDATVIGQSFPVLNTVISNIVVTDGILTIGANGGPSSHTFLNDVRLKLTGSAKDFNYAEAYQQVIEEIEAGIEGTVAQPAQVRAIELFTIDGRRITTAHKGLVILKKRMSDGTVRTEKVVRK